MLLVKLIVIFIILVRNIFVVNIVFGFNVFDKSFLLNLFKLYIVEKLFVIIFSLFFFNFRFCIKVGIVKVYDFLEK